MDFPPDEDYDSLLQDELEMIQSGEIGLAHHQQQAMTDEERFLFGSDHEWEEENVPQTVQPKTACSGEDSIDLASQTSFGGVSAITGGPVNRRLFGAASTDRVTSTPFVGRTKPIETEIVQTEENPKRSRFDRDIFGVDLDLYEGDTYTDPVAKKMKIEEEQDLETIEKILALRQRVGGASSNKSSKRNVFYLQKLHEFKMKNLSYVVPQWPFLPIRRSDQDKPKLFVRYHSLDYENRSLNDVYVSTRPGSESLLSESKQQLWNEANDIVFKRVQSRSEQTNPNSESTPIDLDSEENLWVEKYKPRKYLDLLSAETTNRSLLLWLKMWDKIVFGRDFTPKSNLNDTSHKLSNFNKRTGKFESNGGWFQRRPRTNLDMTTDEYGRPVQKVALLHGAPGLGKTTLAHILAKHAGYQPLEINASDDRSPAAFQQALENGTQMSSLNFNDDHRPNCIVLDEIDGAPRQSIEFLVKFATDSLSTKRLKGNAKAKKNILKRPVICICNDVYEPALRSLRLIAFIVQFPPIQVSRLEERLKQIVKRERLKADITALYALAQKTGNDVRSCISALQFFKSEKKAITLQDVMGNSVSRKDQHQGLFAVWSKIFQIQKTAEGQSSFGTQTDESHLTDTARVKSVLESVQAAGDYQRLMSGVFENYLSQKLPDSNFTSIVEALQWFCFSDNIQQKINHQQNYTIYPYLQFGFAKWHLMLASLVWPKINFPTQGMELSQKSATQRNIFESLRKGFLTSSGVRSLGLAGKPILLEAVPFLKRIVSPDLRHLPVELFSHKERQELKHTVEIMADLGLTYVQVRSAEGTYQFHMEPDLEALVKFSSSPGVSLTYFGRQMLAREIEIERINRAAPKAFGPVTEKQTKTIPKSVEKKLPNHLQKLQPKMPMNAGNSACHGNAIPKYFGRNILISNPKQSATTTRAGKSKDPIVKSPIWYHYKEGFNNAVRKDIHMKELL